MIVYRNVDSGVNPASAEWVGRAVRNGATADLAIIADGGASPILGIVVSAEDKLGGQIGVALNGTECLVRLASSGQPNVNQSGYLTANATGYMVPAATAESFACAVLAETKAHGVSGLVPAVVCAFFLPAD